LGKEKRRERFFNYFWKSGRKKDLKDLKDFIKIKRLFLAHAR